MKLFGEMITIALRKEGKWKTNAGEVSFDGNKIYLQTNCASWVKIEWATKFEPTARVLGDAWERSYGDLFWKPISQHAFYPWYFSVAEGDKTRCYGVKTGCNAFCSWTITTNCITLLMDVRCGCVDTQFDGRKLMVAELVSLEKQGDVYENIHDFCKKMCDNPVLPKEPFYGGDDWNAYYGDNSFTRTIECVKQIAECAKGLKNRPYHTINAGWQTCHNWYLNDEYIGGPFTGCNSKFKDMKAMSNAIREYDVRPGIWFRPLETVEYVPDKAILRRTKNVKYLDPTHPFTIEKADADLRRLREWGYDLIMHDFAVMDIFGQYGFAMTQSVAPKGEWAFYDRSKTSAEINKEYYLRTAESADGALINACNTFSHLSAGIFPIYKIGDDTSGYDHRRTVKMGVNTLAFRGMQHGAFYAADPDLVAFTSKLEWEQIEQWLSLLRVSGMPMLVSVEDGCYNSRVREAITESFQVAAIEKEVAKPIDWFDSLTPTKWKTFEGEKTIEWKY